MSDIVSYWDCIFCIPLNLSELYSVKQLSYLETILVFQVLKALLGRIRVAFSLGLIGSHYWSNTLLNTLPDSLWLMRFFTVAGRNKHSSQPCVSPDVLPLLNSFGWFFPGPLVVSSYTSADQYSAEDMRGIVLQVFSVLSLYRSLLW